MDGRKTLTLYLPTGMREDAEAGRHNMIARIVDAVSARGVRVDFRGDGPRERARAAGRPGFHLFHMEPPEAPNTLTLRRVYMYPFWAIERSAKRWEWDVARAAFPGVRHPESGAFARRWRRKLFGDVTARIEGHVLIPLQGRLTERRSFQAASPIQMIEDTLRLTDRPVIATLHPSEALGRAERAALDRLARGTRLQVRAADPALLPGAAYVVTQNSGVAIEGYFLGKPAILYGLSDVHHIALKARDAPPEDLFARIEAHAPDFDAYLHWVLQERSINAGRDGAEDAILAAMRRGGWDI
ncbi:MAG: hypothetical protein ACU0CO_00155 [Shimia sp.]